MSFKCVGCDHDIGWDGEGTFCYTCPCGASVLYEVSGGKLGKIVFPASLNLQLKTGVVVKHLDQYIGTSNHTSPVKEHLIAALRKKGFMWMSECGQCQEDGTLQKELEREKYLAIREAESILREAR